MKAKSTKRGAERRARIETVTAEAAVAGAAAGSLAGLPGAVAGGILGGLAGAISGTVLANEAERREADTASLDREIGVTEGDLGAADPTAPPARVGAYSASSSGAESPSGTPSEGPIQEVDE
jgi:hypothetical protein